MITTETDLLELLKKQQIDYEYMSHPPVYTCEQAEQFRPHQRGASTKNLFLTDRRGHHYYLLMTACEKRVDLRALGLILQAHKLHFGSEEKLSEVLGLTPGAVTVLGLINDESHAVTMLVDADIWDADSFLCHPLVNTATLLLSRGDLERFFQVSGHTVQLVQV